MRAKKAKNDSKLLVNDSKLIMEVPGNAEITSAKRRYFFCYSAGVEFVAGAAFLLTKNCIYDTKTTTCFKS